MEIKDYSARLADARDNFKRDVKRQKDSYNDDLRAQEKNHKAVEKKHFDANKTRIQEISDDSSARIDKMDRKLTIKMDRESDRFRNGLKEAQTQFNDDRNATKSKFDNKLSYLRDSYSKSKNSLERNYNQQASDIDERARNTRDSQALGYNKSVKGVADTYSKKFDDFRAKEDFEKKQLVRNHDSDLQNIAKKDAEVRNKAAISHQEDLNNLRSVAKEEKSQMKDNQSEQIKEIKTNQKLENQLLNQNFTTLTKNISERNDMNRRVSARNNKELLKRKDRDFAKDVYQLKREVTEKLAGGDSESKLDRKVERTEEAYQKRIDTIQESITDSRFKINADKERVSDENLRQMRSSKAQNAKQVESLKKGFEDTHSKVAATNKKDMSTLVKTYRNELSKTIRDSEEQRINSRIKSKNLLNNQRMNFHETITKLSNKNTAAVTSIKNEATKEKSQMIEDYKVKLHNETEVLKNDLRESFATKEESWAKRLYDSNSKIDKVKNQYEEKIERLNKKNAKELVVTREIQQQKDLEERRSAKIVLQDKDREIAFDKKLMKGQFEKRLSDSKNAFDEKSNKLVERYESRISHQRKELTTDMRTKVAAARQDYDRLYKQSQADRANMQFQYEMRVDAMRQNNDQALKRLTSKNRLEKA